MFVSLVFHKLQSTPQCNCVRKWASWKIIWLVILWNRLHPSALQVSARRQNLWPSKWALTDTEPPGALILEFLTSVLFKINFYCFWAARCTVSSYSGPNGPRQQVSSKHSTFCTSHAWAKPGMSSICVNNVSLKVSHTHLFTCVLWLFSYFNVKVNVVKETVWPSQLKMLSGNL